MDAYYYEHLTYIVKYFAVCSLFFFFLAISSMYVETKSCEVSCSRVSEWKDVGFGEFQFLLA